MGDNEINKTQKVFDKRIELRNANTLKPYVQMRRHIELVPIFYKRNSNKTRNCIAQSAHSVNFLNEITDKTNNIEQNHIYDDDYYQAGDHKLQSEFQVSSNITLIST